MYNQIEFDSEELLNQPEETFNFHQISELEAHNISTSRGIKIKHVRAGDETEGSHNTFFIVNNFGHIQIFELPPHDDYYQSLTQRSVPLVDYGKLLDVRGKLISVAGTGTVGNNILEGLARKGFENFRYADSDTLAVHNLNRIHAGINDIGINKTEIARRNIFYINPFAQQEALPDGITEGNVNNFVEGSSVLVSALDNIHIMYLLHVAARQFNVPVILCTDINSKSLFELFPYDKQPNLAPFKGRIKQKDIYALLSAQTQEERDSTQSRLIAKVISPLQADTAMLHAFNERLKGNISYVPQINEAAKLSGVMAAKAIFSLLTGEPLRNSSSVDLTRVLQPRIATVRDMSYHKPRAVVRIARTLRSRKN